MQKKDPISSYKYCPLCAQPLVLSEHDHRQRKVCLSCGFVDYHNPAPAAGAIIVRDSKLLLVKRAADPYKDCWCIPAGFMEWDESPEACTCREIKEETGLEIVTTKLFRVYSGTDDPRTNAVLILFFCKLIGGEAIAGDDASEISFYGKAEIPANIAFVAHRQAIRDLIQEYPNLLK